MTNARRSDLLIMLLLVAAVLWQTAPLLTPPFASGAIVGTDTYRSHDWLEVAKFDAFARTSLLEDGTFPWWNPLLAGGLPQAAHPSDGSLSPLILPSLVFGETLGMKLNIILVALLGTLGVWGLSRRTLGLTAPAAGVAAFAFAWSGWLPARVAVGFYESCLMAAWPALLALWTMPGTLTERRRRWTLAALLLWAGAIQMQLAVPVFVLLMALLWLLHAATARTVGSPIPWGAAVGGVAILAVAGAMGAVKYLPMLDSLSGSNFRVMKAYPDHPDAWYRSWEHVWYALFHHVPNVPITDHDGNPRIQEYMTLLPGAATVVLALGGALEVFRGRARTAVPWLGVGAVFFWLSFGLHAPVDGFEFLRRLPLFSSMRGPLRYLNFPVLLTLCLLAGVGFQAAWAALQARRPVDPRWVVAAIAAVGMLNLPSALSSRSLYESSFQFATPVEATPTPLRSERLEGISKGTIELSAEEANRARQIWNLRKYTNLKRGVPTIFKPEDVPFLPAASAAVSLTPDGVVEPQLDYYGEVWAADPAFAGKPLDASRGRAELIAYRSSEVEFAYDLVGPANVVVNQNGTPGWACNLPLAVDSMKTLGLLVVKAPAGQGSVRCTWAPPEMNRALAASGMGLVGLLLLWPWRGRRGRRGAEAAQSG